MSVPLTDMTHPQARMTPLLTGEQMSNAPIYSYDINTGEVKEVTSSDPTQPDEQDEGREPTGLVSVRVHTARFPLGFEPRLLAPEGIDPDEFVLLRSWCQEGK